jgi:hypothetical protein
MKRFPSHRGSQISKLGLPVERDIYFQTDKTLSAYAREATRPTIPSAFEGLRMVVAQLKSGLPLP